MDVFTVDSVRAQLGDVCDIIMLDNTDSSNTEAKRLAALGAKENTLVIAKKQTQGRGRMGRSFLSNEENGIYMSLILRPDMPVSESVDITVIGALAVAEAIEKVSGAECGIKWVNDVYIGDKKVAGILTESCISYTDMRLDYAIIGIGVNVTEPSGGFDPSIRDIATSIYKDSAPNGVKSLLLSEIIKSFLEYYTKLSDKKYMDDYRRRSNIIGKAVEVYRGNEVISGIAVGIDDNANLIIESDGKAMTFNSGDARVRKQ